MPKFISLASGYKTYATVLAGLLWGVWEWHTGATGEQMPWYIGMVLAALGFHRAAIAKQAKSTQEVTQALVNFVQSTLSQVEEPAVEPSKGLQKGDKVGGIVIGQPSPAGQTDAQAKAETAALNASQAK